MTQNFREIAPCTLLAPVPSVMVACQGKSGKPNIITLAWVGTVCSHPPMVSISVRKERFSHPILLETGEFTLNLVGRPLLPAMDYCGVKSGREVDKFKEMGLTPVATKELEYAPAILEAPAYLSCKTRQTLELGSHDVFISEIVGVHVKEEWFDKDGAMHLERAELIGYNHGVYQTMQGVEGFFGFSLAAPKVYENRMKKLQGEKE